MRVKPDEIDFVIYLLELGNGTTPVHQEIGDDMVKVPQEYLADSTDVMVHKVFPQLENGYTDKYFVSHRAMLNPLNDNVDKLNEAIKTKFPGEGTTYLTANSAVDEDLAKTDPSDFFNSDCIRHPSSFYDTKPLSCFYET